MNLVDPRCLVSQYRDTTGSTPHGSISQCELQAQFVAPCAASIVADAVGIEVASRMAQHTHVATTETNYASKADV